MSNIENPEGGLISIAARLVAGKHLERLNEICENQKSISTAKLQAEVDKIEDKLKDEAVYIRNMVRALKQIKCTKNKSTNGYGVMSKELTINGKSYKACKLKMVEIYGGKDPEWKGWHNLILDLGGPEHNKSLAGPIDPESSQELLVAIRATVNQ